MTVLQTVELAEYETKHVRAPAPTSVDTSLADRLSAGGDLDARLDIRWLADGIVEISATSWVGIVRFSALEIRVLPKLVGGTLRVLQMLEYANDLSLLKQLPTEMHHPDVGPNLYELIVRLLASEAKLLIRDGLIRDYRDFDDSLTVMRGRLRMKEQFLKRYGSLQRLECSFDEYDGDIPDNQLLAAALTAASNTAQDSGLKAECRTLMHMLNQVCEPRTLDADYYLRRIRYGRRNAHYQSAHHLSALVLRGLALQDLYDTSSKSVTAFMLNMNRVFEDFVSRLVSDSLGGSELRVNSQQSIGAVIIDEQTGKTYSRIRPDLVITDSSLKQQVPVDVKYKLYDLRKVTPADIYQSFTYGHALCNSGCASAGLIYPSPTTASGPRLKINRTAGSTVARFRGYGLDVPSILAALSSSNMEVVHSELRAAIRDMTGLASPEEIDPSA